MTSTPDQPCPVIETLTLNDLSAILKLVERLKWTHVEADLNVMFHTGLFLGVRGKNGEIIATGALFPYGDNFASIGMIMVSPDHRRKGYGKAVMHALHDSEIAQGRSLSLIATDEGEPLYQLLGYQVTSRVRKFFGDPERVLENAKNLSLPGYKIRRLTEADLPTVIKLDAQSRAAAREKLMRLRFAQSEMGVVIEQQGGELVAFAFSCHQRQQCHIGPIIAPNRDIALAMVLALVKQSDLELRIDIPEERSDLYEILPKLGFRLIANPPAMMRTLENGNIYNYPEARSGYWALMSQAYG